MDVLLGRWLDVCVLLLMTMRVQLYSADNVVHGEIAFVAYHFPLLAERRETKGG